MGARNIARIWLLGGIAVTVLLAVASWFLLISPKYSEASDVRSQVEDTQTQLITLRKKIAGLESQRAQLPKFRAALKVNERALPSDSGIPDFLRQLQASGEKTSVTVSGVSVAVPAKAEDAAGVWQLPVTLTANGEPDDLGKFLDDLQTAQPRAVLIQSATLTQSTAESTEGTPTPAPSASASTTTSKSSLSLSLMAYVAPPAGAGTPIVTTN